MTIISTNRVQPKVQELDDDKLKKTIVLSNRDGIGEPPEGVIVAKPVTVFSEPGEQKPGAGPFITTQNMTKYQQAAMEKRRKARKPVVQAEKAEVKKRGRPKKAKK